MANMKLANVRKTAKSGRTIRTLMICLAAIAFLVLRWFYDYGRIRWGTDWPFGR
jgi:hypothetical protein